MSVVPCDICDSPAAKFHCNTCGDALCATCKERHLKSKGTKTHVIVPYAKKLDPKYLAGLLCNTHNTNAPEYWCDTCSKPICGSCITNEHKGHQFSNITAILSEKRDAMLEEMKTLRDKTVSEWAEVLKQAQDITINYLANIDEIDKELEETAKEMHKEVDIILSQRKQSLQEMKTIGVAQLQELEEYLIGRLQKLKEEVERYEEQQKDSDPNVLLQFKGSSAKCTDKTPPSFIKTASVPIFSKGPKDPKTMQGLFGQLTSKDICHKSNIEIPQLSLIPNPSVQSNFTVDYDYPCIICAAEGLSWVKSGYNKLKVVDRSGSVGDAIYTGFCFNDMAITIDENILLAVSSNRFIRSITKKGKMDSLFRTTYRPTSLCCLDNDDIVVTFSDYGKVTVYSKNGQIIQKLNHIEFRFPMKVAANKVNQDIYVCDHSKDQYESPGKVIAIGADWQIRYQYKGQIIRLFKDFYPVEVCTDQMGHILITDYKNHRVHLLDKDGQFIRYILTADDGLNLPKTIDVDREGYVWVGQGAPSIPYSPVSVFKYLN